MSQKYSKNLEQAKKQVETKQLFLFDMNNTLLNMDQVDWYSYRNPLLSEYKIKTSYKDYLQYVGLKRIKLLQRIFKDKTDQELSENDAQKLAKQGREYKTKTLFSKEFNDMLVLLPGIKEFLDWAKKQGKLMVVVTSTSRRYVPRILEVAGIKHYFDAIISADDVSCGKPCSEPFEKGAEAVGMSADQAVAFEDSSVGIKSAQTAGAYVIGVLTPGNNDDVVQNADAIITDYRQLLE